MEIIGKSWYNPCVQNKSPYSAKQILNLVENRDEKFWNRERERSALRLFHSAAHRVPAYRDFLKKHRINPATIKTFSDFQLVPPVTKKTYLREYPLEKLCWDGSLRQPLVFTATSGSTGEPFYFPRMFRVDQQTALIHEMFMRNRAESMRGPTLVLVCFGMGVWIGGVITYQSFEIMREQGYPISILTPGINKQEIFNALRRLASHFAQTILIGYPPFLKDVIDEAPQNGINIRKLHLRMIFAAEAFTEKFRDYVSRRSQAQNALIDTMNIYGSADIGAMAFETPLSILIRRLAMGRWRLFADIFHQIQRTPTLAQYIPTFLSFEEQAGELFLTGDNVIPLIRYSIGDHGGIFSFKELMEKCGNHGLNPLKAARAQGIAKYTYELPFVYVYERVDMSTTLYGLQVYPETVREVLIDAPMNKYCTGKLTLITKYDRKQNQYLEINLELRKHRKIPKKIEKILLSQVVSNLRLKNSEYRELYTHIKDRAFPKLVFWPAEHPRYFKPGIKQKWVRKQ